MVLYNIYIFNRKGVCLYYREWVRGKTYREVEDEEEKRRLVYGAIYSLTDLVNQMASNKPSDGCLAIKTNAITTHVFQSLSGFRFIMTTDNKAGDMRQNIRHIYANIWLECVVKSPLYNPDKPLDSPLFVKQLNAFVETLSCYTSAAPQR